MIGEKKLDKKPDLNKQLKEIEPPTMQDKEEKQLTVPEYELLEDETLFNDEEFEVIEFD